MVHFLVNHGQLSERIPLVLGDKTAPPETSERAVEQPFRHSRKVAFIFVLSSVILCFIWKPTHYAKTKVDPVSDALHDSPSCIEAPCFSPAKMKVDSKPGFPSFLEYANKGAINVSFDGRSLLLNKERAFLLGGSLHPSRATKATWDHALNEAVRNGLNLITLYVMWEDHQPVATKDIDWSFQKGVQFDGSSKSTATEWSLASAIRSAARRGLFVHIRIGPYDCAEYTYGGIPEFIPLQYPNIEMRRPNLEWLQVMRSFVAKMIDYIDDNKLWAHQGGPIILGQIENELGGELDPVTENLLFVDATGEFVAKEAVIDPTMQGLRSATLQDYANWCGRLVEELAPNVTWTMCNGFSAENTILTCNAISEATTFLENHGDNGRVQIDQPPMFTEFEGGFQIWGEDSENPTDYFWGRTARAMAHDALRWFARGGTHLNYYMFWGSYNRGRQAAAGITNMYAKEAILCPSGQRHQPKFGHFQVLHQVLADIAPTLLASDTALNTGRPIEILDRGGDWIIGEDQLMFRYRPRQRDLHDVIFIENNAGDQVKARVFLGKSQAISKELSMAPLSSIVLINGMIVFDSALINPRFMAFERVFSKEPNVPLLLDWTEWEEPIGASGDIPRTKTSIVPIEQTKLNVESQVYSDYAWYETSFECNETINKANISISTQRANGVFVYIDDVFFGAADDHLHKEGPLFLTINAGTIATGEHKLSILSESLGYNNLIGRWGGSTTQKTKGITGDVTISIRGMNVSLVDGREWRSFPGLHGESFSDQGMSRTYMKKNSNSPVPNSPKWYSALFDTPTFEPSFQGLFLKLNSGRGHLYLNGVDLGRYWNITKGTTSNYTQEYYFLPKDYVFANGRLNELVVFNPFPGSQVSAAELLLSWTEASDSANMKDQIDFPFACL